MTFTPTPYPRLTIYPQTRPLSASELDTFRSCDQFEKSSLYSRDYGSLFHPAKADVVSRRNQQPRGLDGVGQMIADNDVSPNFAMGKDLLFWGHPKCCLFSSILLAGMQTPGL